MLKTPLKPSLFRFRTASCRSQHLCRRYESQDSTRRPVPWRQDTGVDQPSVLIEDHFTRSTLFTFDFFKRLAKFSLVGLFALGITGWTAFEGVHMWVEKVELAEDQDNEVRRWEWDRDAEKWSGGSIGGTDSALGFKARHAVRSAWIAQNWGTGSGASVIGSNAFTGRNPSTGSLNIIEARLEFAQNFLAIAVKIAEERMSTGSVRPQTMVELLSRHAGILERMGTRDALFESRSQYERVWAGLPGKGIEAARTALKVGDLNYRLGDSEDALTWWARAINLTQGDGNRLPTINETPTVPESAPSSPSAQRTLISTLVSLSAYYSTSGQLKQAQSVQEASLSLLRSVPSPQSLASASHPQALHSLYLLHRSSLLSIHLAEVLYALRSPSQTSIQYLQRAAESSERVALALTGLPFSHPDAPGSAIPHPPASEAPLMSSFQKSLAMRKPAKSLLRDARRSAAEAWNLIGILSEGPDSGKAQGGEGMERALECYERALGWAGVAADQVGGIGEAGEGTPEAEWKLIWGNYVRAREAVRKQVTKE
ncbi:hypothetical protein SERLA73DRAFT_117321 [Serpula lacrymans var. lacrymans S7.3]|uniref:Uncharacterized protein n=2 Tax=Serpula lacrymans var. lacrymans TaxID=341189 RepID=F8QGW1_SERL3|nr:uncharacterized protein SERLADRAFT_358822 [Serpula lacrymans var. lacrymans S7.9]EGN92443.1 hypothetical protein SERLA73DRAFT_117321 [Serpula lacrymans var. lacrymans S7.3]EGO18570.1 hypothetical protein SERLADRAFT_358822 [Serpula lacrymans var. lacrymans S7.9]